MGIYKNRKYGHVFGAYRARHGYVRLYGSKALSKTELPGESLDKSRILSVKLGESQPNPSAFSQELGHAISKSSTLRSEMFEKFIAQSGQLMGSKTSELETSALTNAHTNLDSVSDINDGDMNDGDMNDGAGLAELSPVQNVKNVKVARGS